MMYYAVSKEVCLPRDYVLEFGAIFNMSSWALGPFFQFILGFTGSLHIGPGEVYLALYKDNEPEFVPDPE